MKKTAALGVSMVAVLAAAVWFFEPGTSQSPLSTESTPDTRPKLSQTGEGMRVYLDPTTGEIIPQPVEAPEPGLPKDITDPMSTSSEGLVVEPAPGGGVMVDLRGRFRNIATATLDADGNLTTSCDTGSADSGEPAGQATDGEEE
jgi:hypothetical protein